MNENETQDRYAAIVHEAGQGNEDAFQAIFELLVDRLYHYALAQTKSEHAADDLVQNTFIDLWKALPDFSYKNEETFKAFVFKILKRKIWRYRLTHRTALPLEERHITEHYEMNPEDYRHLEKEIDKLKEKYREVIRLRYWGGLSFKEIAQALGVTESDAKVRHHRAIKQLQVTILDYRYVS